MEEKYKIYEVGGTDYSASSFEQKFTGRTVEEVVKEIFEKNDKGIYEDEENYIEVRFSHETSDKEAFFKQREQQDYDDSKHTKLFLEDEILKG